MFPQDPSVNPIEKLEKYARCHEKLINEKIHLKNIHNKLRPNRSIIFIGVCIISNNP